MPDDGFIANHYTQGNLLDTIRTGVDKLGKTAGSISIDDLGPVDEFHRVG